MQLSLNTIARSPMPTPYFFLQSGELDTLISMSGWREIIELAEIRQKESSVSSTGYSLVLNGETGRALPVSG